MIRTSLILSALLLTPISLSAQQPDSVDKDYSAELPRIPALTPDQSAKQFDVLDGFEVQLVAAEPLVQDPVAFAFDTKGQLWVVEMCDYSEQDKERLGRVAVLRDTNGDGVMDTRKTFVQGLSWPTALWPWQDGVIVADAPNVTFHRDTDGDMVADKTEAWFVGFGRTNVQGLINSFRWGIDGWIHGVTSSSGADLQALDGTKIALGRRDFAIDPLTKKLRAETGGGQHGMYFNRWGDKFVTSNSDHLQQIVDIESWLTSQNSAVSMPSARKSIAEDGPQAEVYRVSDVEPWRIVRTRLRMSGVAPGVVEGGGRAAGYFTGATGTCIMDVERGFGVPGEPHDTAIVCDVGSNLVHRKRLIDQGLFYSGQRIDQQTELLRSRDIWFRPVQIGEGPDGGLYIADMYREVIEHPASLPPMIKKHLDLTSGRDKGRVWRLARKDQPRRPLTDFTKLDNVHVIEQLSADVSSQRILASQALIERFSLGKIDAATIASIEKNATSAVRDEARLLSLYLLARVEKLTTSTIQEALSDKNPRIVAQAIELAGQSGSVKELAAQLKSVAASTKDNRMMLALAKCATRLVDNDRNELLALMLPKDSDPLVRAVVATATGKDSWKLLQAVKAEQLSDTVYAEWLVLWLPQWADEIKQNKQLASFVTNSLQSKSSRQAAWLSALARINSPAQAVQLIKASEAQNTIDSLLSEKLEKEPTAELVRWLRLASPEVQSQWSKRLIDTSVSETIQVACIDSLSWANHSDLASRVIDNFTTMTPSLQLVGLRALVSRQDRQSQLLAALKEKKIARSQIPADIRQSLVSQKDRELAQQFKDLLNQVSSDRASVLEKYRPAVEELTNNIQAKSQTAKRGKEVFTKVCAQCHKLGDVGNDVGPPLKQLGDKSPAQLLESILDPSREVDPKYMGYTFLLDDGVVITGIILQESGQQIVIAEAGGKQTTLERSKIDEIKSSGLSLMPNGLEDQVSPEQMAELIQFLKSPK